MNRHHQDASVRAQDLLLTGRCMRELRSPVALSDACFMRQALQHIAYKDLAGFVIAGERDHHEIDAATGCTCVRVGGPRPARA